MLIIADTELRCHPYFRRVTTITGPPDVIGGDPDMLADRLMRRT
jgi:hypothetical protein